jgi:hypothetical protein
MGGLSFMNKQGARQRLAAVLGLTVLVLTVAVVDARKFMPANQQLAVTDDPDFLTLNPEGE